MAAFDDDLPRTPGPLREHVIGQDLSVLSVEDLTQRVAALRSEIERLEAAIAAKTAQRSAADSLFRL
ncbi:DUF1192 domain-containing protein [Hansschlegelia sp.]|uniref:DUF1192 domain-containing protein n=1 Tax=Hansschlegelia sp. TaxID=2041892 RepID=UPI002CE44C97|nr:DUF1192 domain-containing protein [Hansschlegelia sp.]HVI27781.1 DUF1192 domain-containing protein [Hansschlegelia sp.]